MNAKAPAVCLAFSKQAMGVNYAKTQATTSFSGINGSDR